MGHMSLFVEIPAFNFVMHEIWLVEILLLDWLAHNGLNFLHNLFSVLDFFPVEVRKPWVFLDLLRAVHTQSLGGV